MGNKKSYYIKKFRTAKTSNSDKMVKTETIMLNNLSEVQEYSDKNIVEKFCESMNKATDSNCVYKVIEI